MKKIATGLVLVAALALPVILFLLLPSQFQLGRWLAAAIAVVSGWALNIAWAAMAQTSTGKDRSNENFLPVATRFGWVCPGVFVLTAWAIWRFVLGHGA